MNLLQTFEYCFSKEHFANWNGRASRSEFLWFWFILLLSNAIGFFVLVFLSALEPTELDTIGVTIFIAVVLGTLFIGLMITIASITVMGRRFHDLNLSAWFILITMVPFIGTIMWLVCAFGPSHQGENKFEVVNTDRP